jgi:predicted transcriptional regulator
MPDTEELLDRTGMKSELFANIKNILVDRNILLEKTSSQSYVLSAIGRQFFEDLKPLYRTASEQLDEE